MQAVEDHTYNGWKNYPTWNVHLWLSNDQGLYDYCREIAANASDTSSYGVENFKRINTADAIREFVRDDLAPDLGASFAADLLGYALDEVDWLEIADAFLED